MTYETKMPYERKMPYEQVPFLWYVNAVYSFLRYYYIDFGLTNRFFHLRQVFFIGKFFFTDFIAF